ncbi:carboxypeptidase M32 [Phaeovulum vinaykumarii]|uniref:Metal-dependent carboxypeptidase n=1 Tax=Phaeovulum vinaykumarii TaxID=407234 RepID=A0A1N7M1K7_9RHOB|nr:carboxypeptidase M32 [Phaeovulum vinaykumarii]SIS79909.1 carboxypeptidase Taq Metallo peptidase. MEROPS family M32 [Phaeovulum vinaykumarii]SOC09502.1 carboxypeptidase Taq [Phaeovulum vinaykumarii]
MTAFAELMAHQRRTEALAAVAGRLGWDQETVMPRGAAEERAEEMAAMEAVLHARRTDPRIPEWLAAAEAPDVEGARALALIAHAHRRAAAVPERLATELAQVTSLAQGVWAEARAAEDVARFLPLLTRVVALRREEGQAMAAAGVGGGDAYDALIDGYEPGARAAEIAAMFARMRPRLVALRAAVLGKPAPRALTGQFPTDGQMRLAREVAGAFGYDWTRGRLDLSVHPFTSGSGSDVRITTRVAEDDPFNCLYSTIHEVGHALYEQGVAARMTFTPLGGGVSMGVHESQSRICENQIGRGMAFSVWLHARMQALFGDYGLAGPEALHAAVNRVHPGFIRTEADEVQYNLHIMLRFDLERALFSGALEVADLEEAWNTRFAADFGVPVTRPSQGLLQDVHWSAGLFGYFPTYTLGNVYAGCLNRAMRADLPDLDAHLAAGAAQVPVAWLAEKIHRHGALFPPAELITRACGAAPDETALLEDLEAKFGALYDL